MDTVALGKIYIQLPMRRFCLYVLLPCLLFSCSRQNTVEIATRTASEPPPAAPSVMPLAILQAGEYPLWFQFTDQGLVLIETIEDACYSAAFAPWPLAIHARFMLAHGEDLLMAVNRDGFIRLSPREGGQTVLYRFSGGEFWQQYTVGACALLDTKPAALLYLDDRFFDSSAPLPSPRQWTFDPQTAGLIPFSLPLLDAFAPEDGWDIDALRRGGDGNWYFRAVRKTGGQPELRLFRSGDLGQESEPVSRGAFQNAALPEPLSSAPGPLRDMLAAVLVESGCGSAAVVSPEFPAARSFAADREKAAMLCFYSGIQAGPGNAFLVAATPQGGALYTESGALSVRGFSLPPLPEGFQYTGIGVCGDTLCASWEEQLEYSIGASGFMAIRLIR